MQKNRLFHMLYYIIEKGKVTAPELAEKFEVSIRTVYRDIDAISYAGIPIYATQGKGGGISILDDFALEKSLFTKSEREQLLNSLQSIAMTGEQEANELLTKLSALFQTSASSWIEVDFSDWSNIEPERIIFNDIKIAILNHNVVSFDYFSATSKTTTRSVHPYKLVFKSKNWYLYGYCLYRKDFRYFKLTRIKDFSICEEKFTPVAVPCVIEKQIHVEKIISVSLKFDKEIAFRVYDEFASDVKEDEYGNLLVDVKLPENEMLFSYILSFGDTVEVLHPKYIREMFIDKLHKMKEKYKT